MGTTIPQAMLTPPPTGTAILRRERLFALLAPGLTRRLVLVIAPAGYGKTTLVAGFSARAGLPVAWCRLDHHDRDPMVLVDHLRAALGHPFPALARVPPAPAVGGIPPATRAKESAERGITRLCLDLEATVVENLLLVLDDLHLAESSAVAPALEFFLDNALANVHFCFISRSPPALGLARRRSQQQLVEIGAADLQFTPAEIQSLFTHIWNLPLDNSTLGALFKQSQGWAAGLVLLRDALRRVPPEERSVFLDRLALTEEIYDYLADEVWRQQSASAQRFLLHTAILDPVTPPAAAALSGQRAPLRTLRRLEQAGLFVTCDDPRAGVYRYHPLLRDFLHRRLRADFGEPALTDLHRRAADHFHSVGDLPTAISHALDARAWESAAAWIETTAEETLRRGRLTTLMDWLDHLPTDVLNAHPWLILWRGRAHHLLGASVTSESDIAQALSLFQVQSDRRGLAAARVTQAALRFRRGDYAGAAENCRAVLSQSNAATERERGEANDWLGCCLLETGELSGAARAFAEALALHQAQGNLAAQAVAYHHLASVALSRGDLAGAERQSLDALDLFRKLGDFQQVLPLLRLTEIYHLRGEDHRAVDASDRALRVAGTSNLALARAYALTFRADALAALGQTVHAEEAYQQALALGDELGEPAMCILPRLGLSRLRLASGLPDRNLIAELERRARTTRDPALRAAVSAHLGDVRQARGGQANALRGWHRAQALWKRLGTDHEIARLKLCQANLAWTMGRARWEEDLREALRLSDARGYDFIFTRTERSRAVPLLVAALARGVEIEQTGRLLGQIGNDAIVPLLDALANSDPAVRIRVTQALGDIGDSRAAHPLQRLQRNSDPAVRQAALAALRRIARRPPVPLRVFTLGSFQVTRGDDPIAEHAWGRKAARRLLKILMAKRSQVVPREVLIDLLWPKTDVETGLKRLKALVHHLRRVLEPDPAGLRSGEEPSSYIILEGDGYVFRPQAAVWLDVDEFAARVRQADRLAHQGLGDEALAEYAAADALYRGDFLEEDLYEDWCALERESLRETRLRVLDAFADGCLARSQFDGAAECYRRALAADPLREGAHRGLIIALARSGRRAEALRHYQTCRKILLNELSVEPMPETQSLYQRLLRQEPV